MKTIRLALMLALNAALATSARAAMPALVIHIAANEREGGRRLALIGSEAQFAVVITNVSSRPLRLWTETCSWGYYALSFEIRDIHGVHQLRRKPVGFLKNIPQFVTLAPGESLQRMAALVSDDWPGFPLPAPGQRLPLTFRARFEIKPDAKSRQYQVWTGQATTVFARYVLERGSPTVGTKK